MENCGLQEKLDALTERLDRESIVTVACQDRCDHDDALDHPAHDGHPYHDGHPNDADLIHVLLHLLLPGVLLSRLTCRCNKAVVRVQALGVEMIVDILSRGGIPMVKNLHGSRIGKFHWCLRIATGV